MLLGRLAFLKWISESDIVTGLRYMPGPYGSFDSPTFGQNIISPLLKTAVIQFVFLPGQKKLAVLGSRGNPALQNGGN